MLLTQPVISPLSAAAVATSSGLNDRASPAVAITGMVCDTSYYVTLCSFSMQNQ